MKKKGLIELTTSGIVILIVAVVIIALILSFIKGMFGKTAVKLDEQIGKEPEPPTPTAAETVTLSRETVTTNPGKTEALKISLFNPTNKDWTFRDAIQEDDSTLCGVSGDNICYINSTSAKENICNNPENAISNDKDCERLDEIYYGGRNLDQKECDDEGSQGPDSQGICFISDEYCFNGSDPDCAPTEGVHLLIECSQELNLQTQTNPKTIQTGESTTFTAILKVNKDVKKGMYLCKIRIEGEGAEGITKDLQIMVT